MNITTTPPIVLDPRAGELLADLRPRRGVGADHHPPVEPAQVSRSLLGRDRFLMAAVKEELAAASGRAMAAYWRCGRWSMILAVLAMAKPFLESVGGGALLAGRRTHRVIVPRRSLSMGYDAGRRLPVRSRQGVAANLSKTRTGATRSAWS